MSTENSPPSSPSTGRRASLAPGQKISELFSRSPGNSAGATGTASYPSPIVTAAAHAQAHQCRRMSISTLGLSGSPSQPSPFGSGKTRHDSVSSGGSTSPNFDDSAIEEGDAPATTPTTPFARRMSFGARALRDVRGGSGSYNGRASTNLATSPATKGRGLSSSPEGDGEAVQNASNGMKRFIGEGFNWSDQLRNRAQRSSSITSPTAPPTSAAPSDHARAGGVTSIETRPKSTARAPNVPDAFQERILKGDFYMD